MLVFVAVMFGAILGILVRRYWVVWIDLVAAILLTMYYAYAGFLVLGALAIIASTASVSLCRQGVTR